jgi:hypothetical protein
LKNIQNFIIIRTRKVEILLLHGGFMTSPVNNNTNPLINPTTPTNNTTTPTSSTTTPASNTTTQSPTLAHPVEASKKGGSAQYVDPSLAISTTTWQQAIIQNQILQATQQTNLTQANLNQANLNQSNLQRGLKHLGQDYI